MGDAFLLVEAGYSEAAVVLTVLIIIFAFWGYRP